MGDLQASVKRLEEEVKNRFVGNDDAIRVLTLNLLHERSTALIRAPRGRGKSTLMLLFLKGLFGEDFIVLSGASEIKRGEVVARLHIPSLEKEGVERVIWSAFVRAKGKGIDEVNRLNPYTASNIYHLLQFGEVWAYGQRYVLGDFVLLANENPADPTTFIHPPPFYDRFDVCVNLSSLPLSDKFRLQKLVESYGSLVDTMPQVIDFETLREARREVKEVEVDVDLLATVNVLIRDLQVCIRGRDVSRVKPPALCEGCHFVHGICSSIREGPSERATLVLYNLLKAKAWMDGKVTEDDVYRLAPYVLIHRMELVKQERAPEELVKLLRRQRELNEERRARKQWAILSNLYKSFNKELYRLAGEIAVEDLVFAEEIMKLEQNWVSSGLLQYDQTLTARLMPDATR
ncbi:MAG: MoxR family ATPase [Thermofilaceae archaeon]